ncbi:MAG: type II CAAX endopeptidase family protein [Cyclobacteriaceae bacterium]
MPAAVIHLTKGQIGLIKERIQEGGIKTPELAEDLLDHFCVAIEEEMGQGHSFESALEHIFNTLQEDELKTTEMKTQELLEGKKIFYPNLKQSFGLLALLVGGTIFLTIVAIAIGGSNSEEKQQYLLDQYLPLMIVAGNLIVIGGVIAYAIREIRHTQISAPVFSFRSVPAYVYGIILLIAVLSQFWLEPLALFLSFSQDAITERMGNYHPGVVMMVIMVNVMLMELLFRGIILKGLLMTTTPVKAILWSSFLCALSVFTSSFFYFIISLMLGWLYWKTRSLFTPIFLFMAATLIGYIASLVLNPSEGNSFTWWDYFGKNLMVYVPLVAGSLLLTIGLFYYLHRKLSLEAGT